MYECNHCGMWFFLEEGYEPETDRIICPSCKNSITETQVDDCPLGGDTTNDCAGCIYASDYHFVNGECIRRE